jgi:two-component system sensor histidine kinase BaeS
MRSTIHEMRNQLTVSVANIEAFIDGKLAPTPERLEAVLHALRKLDALMYELRPSAASETSATKIAPVDICALIYKETVAIEATAQAAGIKLHVDRCSLRHPECSVFACDPVQVSQVIMNVLLNAIKYTGRGGTVTLYCHREPGVLALDISDSGPGVPLAERQTIFENGVRGSAAHDDSGSGLGLAVVRGIVDAHGGTVTVADSRIGGALFTIRLPGAARFDPACAHCGDLSSSLGDVTSPLHENAAPVA